MASVRVKAYAKLNLTLSVTGVADGYHMLDSLVASVDLYDLIVLNRRKDKLVSVTMHGRGSESIPYESNNAVRAAESFISAFGTDGADITVYKNIPMGLGLGGSSADSAGVLNGLSKLYNTGGLTELEQLAALNGSDTKYMLSGGYARMRGRGDEVEYLENNMKLDILLLAPASGVSTAECFKLFDSSGTFGGSSDGAVKALSEGDKYALAKNMGNSLVIPAKLISEDVRTAFNELSAFDPLAVNMTGSGSGVYALFENEQYCDYAKSRYRGKFRAYKLKTVIPKI